MQVCKSKINTKLHAEILHKRQLATFKRLGYNWIRPYHKNGWVVFDEFQSNLLVMIISMETTTKKFAWYTFNCPYFTIFTLDSIRSSTVPGNTDWLICTKSIVSIFNTPLPTRPKAPTTCGMGSFMTIINDQKPFDCKHRKVHCGY